MSAPLTFLFTDLENSTALWERAPEAMRQALVRHGELIDEAVADWHGRVVKNTGDGVMAVFESPAEAIHAALAAQQNLTGASWPEATGPLKVRMGLHTGESEERDGDYFGSTLNRAARVMGIGHGGQILVSGATTGLVEGGLPSDVSLVAMGEHRLKGVSSPVTVLQVCHPSLVVEFAPLRSLSTLKHNLPARLTSLIGREEEIAELHKQLRQARLLTLLGAGGVGKTTLMLRLGEEAVDEFADGVWLVELATVTDPGAIPERIATTLNVPQQPGRPIQDAVADYLRTKELLLLLDNVEHLVAGTARLAEDLLTQCRSLSLLTTSREALLIDGEVVHRVPSLALPSEGGDLAEIADSGASELFLARAGAVRPGFEATEENAASIAIIVRRLDGIPLALELAAARLRMLTVEQIEERLADRFRLLAGGSRTAVPRQQTLEAAIDWSWNLLDDNERKLLQRLSVFSGGWSLESAASVAGDDRLDDYEVFDNLEHLVDKSLVTVEFTAAGEARYGMFESIRQYAADRLAEAGTVQDVRRAHAAYFVELAKAASPHLVRADMAHWVDRIVLDLDNLRAAVAWANQHDVAMSLLLSGSLLEYEVTWLTPRETGTWVLPAVEQARELMRRGDSGIPQADFLRALMALGGVQGMSGDAAAANGTFEECIQLAQAAGESRVLAHAVSIKSAQIRFQQVPGWGEEVDKAISLCREEGYDVELAWLLWARGWMSTGDESIGYYQEAALVFSAINNPLFNALALRMQFQSDIIRDDVEQARHDGLAWVVAARAAGSRRVVAQSTSELAHLLRRIGDTGEARHYYKDAIKMWQELGHKPAVAHQLECLAYVAIANGHPGHAAELLGAATEARRRLDAVSENPEEIAELSAAREAVAQAIGEVASKEAISRGAELSLDEAVSLAVGA